MILVRIIREPTSLMEAEMEYKRQLDHAGYEIESDLTCHWQHCLFRDTMDAVVTANVRKVRNETRTRPEPTRGIHETHKDDEDEKGRQGS